MQHEFRIDLRPSRGDFKTASISGSDHGSWVVSFGPIFAFSQKLQDMAERVAAPSHEGMVGFNFEDYTGKRWADHPDLEAQATEFWATTFEFKGEHRPVMPERKAWLVSRAWTTCRFECARRAYPDLFGKREIEQITEDLQMQRPPLIERAFNRLHEAFGYPCLFRLTYGTRLDVVQASA